MISPLSSLLPVASNLIQYISLILRKTIFTRDSSYGKTDLVLVTCRQFQVALGKLSSKKHAFEGERCPALIKVPEIERLCCRSCFRFFKRCFSTKLKLSTFIDIKNFNSYLVTDVYNIFHGSYPRVAKF